MEGKNGKRIYHFELEESEAWNLLQAARMGMVEIVEDSRAVILKDIETGTGFGPFESVEEALDNCKKVFQNRRQAHDKMIDQWCEQAREAGDYEDAEIWSHLKTNMEIYAQNIDLYETEIKKKAAEVRRPKLHIVK